MRELKGILFLAGFTVRSQSYAQSMTAEKIYPEYTILFGKKDGVLPGQARTTDISPSLFEGSLFVPDLNESLTDTTGRWKTKISHIFDTDVNCQTVYEQINKVNPRLVIYSGYGGQIVGRRLLNLNIPFLHIHSGWLPHYRGSTTLYYSWLKENICAASAIILSRQIDQGDIVGQKKYPPPAEGSDPDYLYDGMIRADLLVSILKEYAQDGMFKHVCKQENKGEEYFVIHPLLKHLARLKGKEIIGQQ